MDCSLPGPSVHRDSAGKNIGEDCLHGDLPNPGIEPRSPTLQVDSLPSEPPGKLGSITCNEIVLMITVKLAHMRPIGARTTELHLMLGVCSKRPFMVYAGRYFQFPAKMALQCTIAISRVYNLFGLTDFTYVKVCRICPPPSVPSLPPSLPPFFLSFLRFLLPSFL